MFFQKPIAAYRFTFGEAPPKTTTCFIDFQYFSLSYLRRMPTSTVNSCCVMMVKWSQRVAGDGEVIDPNAAALKRLFTMPR